MARTANGYIKLYRPALNSDIAENANRFFIFLTLLAWANYRPTKVSWRGKPRLCPRGSLVTSVIEVSKTIGVDPKTARKHLVYLEVRGTLVLERSQSGLFVTIPNYEKYQGYDEERSQQGPDAMEGSMEGCMEGKALHKNTLNTLNNNNTAGEEPCVGAFNSVMRQEVRLKYGVQIQEIKNQLSGYFTSGNIPRELACRIEEISYRVDFSVDKLNAILSPLWTGAKDKQHPGRYLSVALGETLNLGGEL